MNASSFRKSARPLLSLLLLSSFAMSLQANELIPSGDMGEVDSILPLKLPTGAERLAVEENSPFTEVFPSNGKSLKLVGTIKQPHLVMVDQPLDEVTGKVIWSFDFKQPKNDDRNSPDPGFNVVLVTGKANHTVVGLGEGLIMNTQYRAGSPEYSWLVKKNLLPRNTWYHFQCEIDLVNQTMTGTVTSELGDQHEFFEVKIPPLPEDANTRIDGLRIGSGAGAGNVSEPLILDNLSVREIAP